MESIRNFHLGLSLSLLLFLFLAQSQLSGGSPSPGRTNPYAATTATQTGHSSRTPTRETTNNSKHIKENQQIPITERTGRNESLFLSNSTDPTAAAASCSEESLAMGKCNRPMGLDMKRLSLELIRHDILRKLRLDENKLPNVTTTIPKEYLTSLLTGIDIQNDSPHSQYDDDHATTEKIIAFSRTRKSSILFLFPSLHPGSCPVISSQMNLCLTPGRG